MKKQLPIIILSVLLAISLTVNLVQSVNNLALKTELDYRMRKDSISSQKSVSGSRSEESPRLRSQPSSPADGGLIRGLGRSVLEAELNKWQGTGLVTNFEFSGSDAIVYLNHDDWQSLTYHNKADFKAGIRAKWPDGSVVFRDSENAERH